MTGTILVVEDDQPILDMMEILLSRLGYTPVLVNNVQDALEVIGRERPCLIILDIMMKPVSGWDFLKKIRDVERTNDVPVIIFTASSAADEEISRIMDPHLGILLKPVTMSDLRQALDHYLPVS
ncbi:MAG: response regulator [Methanoregula sp.]|nr:response regulator [Methanoregula sp.]